MCRKVSCECFQTPFCHQGYSIKERVQTYLKGALNDPIVKLLSENSQLTKIQLETLLIDLLADNLTGKLLKYDEKANFRLIKAKISRGSFNRTLKQSKENVIKSIYTILLLGYLGVLETSSLSPYLARIVLVGAFFLPVLWLYYYSRSERVYRFDAKIGRFLAFLGAPTFIYLLYNVYHFLNKLFNQLQKDFFFFPRATFFLHQRSVGHQN